MPHSPTDEQQQIIAATSAQSSSLMISAYAGTAKTTTLQMAAPSVRTLALALAFNKKIADELKPRLPDHFTVKTLNALGHQAWAKSLPVNSIKLDDRKLGKLVTQTAKDFKIHLSTAQWDQTQRLTSAAMLAGISPNNEGQPLTVDSKSEWADLFDGSSDDFELCYDIARAALIESINQSKQGTISFDDQIYCPTILGGRWPHYPIVFVDESQDLSPLNHRMLQLLEPDRLIAVGDSRQAIYAFRGADATSMDSMRSLSPRWLDLPLTMTFRCPKSIVARQQSHAPGYRAWDGCAEGAVKSWHDFIEAGDRSDDNPRWTISDIKSTMSDLGNDCSAAILCRNNAPLLSLAFKLLRRNVGCHMLGRDIGQGLKNIITKLSDDDSNPIIQFVTKLTDWADHERALALANDKPDKADRIEDQRESLAAVIDGSGARTTGDLKAALDNLFARSAGLITLSSIHRAKGLEFDLVVHLDPFRIPPKWSLCDPTQLQQEKNLLYVAETRTKHTLLNLNLGDFK